MPTSFAPAHAVDGLHRLGSASRAALRQHLNAVDRLAALEAVQLALSETGDGGDHVWHVAGRQLRGVIRPTASFRGADGRLCRHFIYALILDQQETRVEGIACRDPDGIWSLTG